MISVRVKYLFQLRDITGKSEEEVHLKSHATVEDLLKTLANTYGERFRDHLFTSEGRVKPNLQLLIGDRTLQKHEELYGQMLSEDDVLTILSAPGGG